MRVVLDHCVPKKIGRLLVGHEVVTARAAGWDGLENGDLMRAAADAGFDVLVTVDRNLRHQQDPAALPIGVLVLIASRNTFEELSLCFPGANDALKVMAPRTIVEVRAAGPTD